MTAGEGSRGGGVGVLSTPEGPAIGAGRVQRTCTRDSVVTYRLRRQERGTRVAAAALAFSAVAAPRKRSSSGRSVLVGPSTTARRSTEPAGPSGWPRGVRAPGVAASPWSRRLRDCTPCGSASTNDIAVFPDPSRPDKRPGAWPGTARTGGTVSEVPAGETSYLPSQPRRARRRWADQPERSRPGSWWPPLAPLAPGVVGTEPRLWPALGHQSRRAPRYRSAPS